MEAGERIMKGDATAGLFIDADNVDAELIEHAFGFLRERGLRTTVRRAYGGHERLGAVKDVCAAHGVKALTNHGKGTTDALLIIDLMDLLHGRSFPSVIAIASADADFAPMAVRLREAGCHTLCFAHPDKADADALRRAYDEVLFVDSRGDKPGLSKATAKRPSRSRAVPIAAPGVSAPARPPAPSRRAVAQADDVPTRLKALLSKVPGLASGKPVELNEVVVLLRREGLLGKTGSGPKFLGKHAPYLRLTPDKQPNKIHWSR
ncbi:MAG TPA: NYN domain-containing protein [Ramlibacter sp.]|nr:NYN domain-containing protein [Ramlibacter sp.]